MLVHRKAAGNDRCASVDKLRCNMRLRALHMVQKVEEVYKEGHYQSP